MLRRLTFAVVALSLSVMSLGQQNFARRSLGIRSGVVLLETARIGGYAANYAPHVLFNFDSNKRVKPGKLYLYNPAHNSQYTATDVVRWDAIADIVGSGPPPAVGTSVTKRDAIYWEVPISTVSDVEISKYDFLYLAAYGATSLNSAEREKLRRFCDKGGVLWVDISRNTVIDAVNNLPIPFSENLGALPSNTYADFTHPLLSFPTSLNAQDMGFIQTVGGTSIQEALVPPEIRPIEGHLIPDFSKLDAIAADQGGTVLSVAKVGDGYMVITTRATGQAMNHDPGSTGGFTNNVGPIAASPTFDRASDAAAKLILNMIHLVSGHQQIGAGSRKANSTPIDVDAPLLKAFDTSDMGMGLTGGVLDYRAPCLYRGLLLVSDGNRVLAFDANPKNDLDGDGDPDDGVRDLALGYNRDLVWESEAQQGPISPPVAADVPNGIVRDQILVTDAAGNLVCFNAFPSVGGINPPVYTTAPPNGAGESIAPPYTPAVHDGLVFIGDIQESGITQVGRVWVVNAATGQRVSGSTGWSVGGAGTQLLPPLQGPPTVGYIPIADNSGGMDKVVYVPTQPNPNFGGPNSNAGVYSFWLGVKGERPSSFTVSGSQLIVASRASGQGLDVFTPGESPLGVKITLIKPNGDPYTTAEMQNTFTGAVSQSGGILNFTMKVGAVIPVDTGIRLDYHINWGTGSPSMTSQILRGFMIFPDDTNKSRRVIGNIAMSAQGTIYAVVANPSGEGGAFYALREEGRGNFKVVTRYEMYREHTIQLNQTGPIQYLPTLLDTDPLQNLVGGILSGQFRNLSFSGGPTVKGDVVYCIARGFKNGFIPCSIVMAFKAEPETVEIKTGDIGGNFSILQPDVARSTNKGAPEVYSSLQPNQFVYEREPGSDFGTIRIENLSSTTRGPMINTISTSQPIIIRRSGQPDLFLEPGLRGNRYNPMLWFFVMHGDANVSPPLVTGNTLFVAGASALPNILSGLGFASRGMLTAIEADISPTDAFLGSDPSRPWQRQLYRLKTTGDPNNPILGNPDVVWPQGAGIRTFEDFRIRVLQTVLGNSPNSFGVVGGDGGVYSWSSAGVWGFTRSDFIVADEGRIVRFDPSGNAIWSSDASFASGQSTDTGGASTIKPMVRPTRAYPFGDRGLVVVDSGGNRIIRLDYAGRETRSLEGFKLDPNFMPADMGQNDPLTLRDPKDVLVYTTVESGGNPFTAAVGTEYWIHYFIADSGNKRLLEIIDRYSYDVATRRVGDPITYNVNGVPERALGVLYWHSPQYLSGKNFDYNSLSRVFVPDNTPNGGHYVYAAGLGTTMPTRADVGLDAPAGNALRAPGDGNGGIILFDGPNSKVINEVVVPAVANNVLWDDQTGTWTSPGSPQRIKKLSSLSSVTMRNLYVNNASQLAIMFTDTSGVYEVVQSGTNPDVWTVVWMMPKQAYRSMRRDLNDNPSILNPQDFRPTYARRLESGEVLVVNGYVGTYRKALFTDPYIQFNGEVLQVDGDIDPTGIGAYGFGFGKKNLGFKSLSVRFKLPPVQGARDILLPVFADRK